MFVIFIAQLKKSSFLNCNDFNILQNYNKFGIIHQKRYNSEHHQQFYFDQLKWLN